MLVDLGTWDVDCRELVREIREGLVALAPGADTVTLLQGSGSYAVEATLGCAVPADGKLLVLNNGAYGERMGKIATTAGLPHRVHVDPEDRPHDPSAVERILADDPAITHVSVVHGETTTGLLNPVGEIGDAVKRQGRRLIVDAISTFGAYPAGPGELLDFERGPIDHLVGSANKCIEGVPGFGFILSRREAIEAMAGQARSLCLDVYDQWSQFEKTGRFRYTPPTHVLLAFRQALRELEAEGGPTARGARYAASHQRLLEGMAELGFEPVVPAEHRSFIITAFHHPSESFDFDDFYAALHGRGYILYPGKLSDLDSFRIGTIGQLDHEDIDRLLVAIAEVRRELGSW